MTTLNAPPATAAPVTRRAYSLDALRGLSILMMVFSGILPEGMPTWMHHAQVPPGKAFDPTIPGITWVDLVFPFFLFSMGAAIPLALTRRLEKGAPMWRVVLGVVQRFVLLGLFSVYVVHMRPWAFYDNFNDNRASYALVLLSFALLFPTLGRLPEKWPSAVRYGIRAAAWVAIVALMLFAPRPEGRHFDLGESDIIIMILANAVLGASLIWLATRNSLLMRLGAMAFLMAIRMSVPAGGEQNWVDYLWHTKFLGAYYESIKWLLVVGYNSVLFVVLPGTIAGDWLLAWMRDRNPEAEEGGWKAAQMAGLAAIGVMMTLVVLWGLFSRHLVITVVACVALSAGAFLLSRNARSATERLLRTFVQWGTFWLFLGLVFEPYEGGIKKDPATMSYYFVTVGLALFLMVFLVVVMDVFGKHRWLGLLTANGQNPMVAYTATWNLVHPVMALIGLKPILDRTLTGQTLGLAYSVLILLLTALSVSVFTRYKLFLRT